MPAARLRRPTWARHPRRTTTRMRSSAIPEKWIDFGYRATHLMTVAAKQIITGFYGRGPRYSYFHGCSTGGQQALMEAQRFPDDYDGILGGSPANNRTHVHTNAVWVYKQFHAT